MKTNKKMPKAHEYIKADADKESGQYVISYHCANGKRFDKCSGVRFKIKRAISEATGKRIFVPAEVLTAKQTESLEQIKKTIEAIAASLNARNIQTSPEAIREALKSEMIEATDAHSAKPLLPFLQNLDKDFVSGNDGEKSKGTLKGYKTLAKHVHAYEAYLTDKRFTDKLTSYEKRLTVPFVLSQVDKQFFSGFNTFLMNKHTLPDQFHYANYGRSREAITADQEHEPMKLISRHSRIKGLKSVMNFLRRTYGYQIGTFKSDTLKNVNDFTQFKFPTGARKRTKISYGLTPDEINSIYELRKSPKVLNNEYRDILLTEIDRTVLNCYLGQRFGDAVNGWDENDIQHHKDGTADLVINASEKTNTSAVIPILEGALKVLRSREWKPLPAASNPFVNKWIKIVCRLAGITQLVKLNEDPECKKRVPKYTRITCHSWRHSLVNILTDMNISDRDIIAMTGHRTVKSLDAYRHGDKKQSAKNIRNHFNSEAQLRRVS